MTYTHANFVTDIFRTLGITVPAGAVDDLQMQASVCLAEIESIKKDATKQVIVASYRHKHGTDVRIFRTEAGADKWREDIATNDWDMEMDDTPAPADAKERANRYWEAMNDSDREWFETETADVED